MVKLIHAFVAALVGAAFVAGSAVADPFQLKGDPKPAWIYFNVKNDGGWTQAIDEARIRMESELGYKIPYVEKVPEVQSVKTDMVEHTVTVSFDDEKVSIDQIVKALGRAGYTVPSHEKLPN